MLFRSSDADAEIAAGMNEATLSRWNDLVREQTTLSVATANKAGVPVLLVIQADLHEGADGNAVADDEGRYDWAASLASPGVEIVRMKELLKGRDVKAIYADGAHVRAEGHKIIAQALAERVRAGFGVPRSQP